MELCLTAHSLSIGRGYAPILERLNFTVAEGEALHLVGVNGSGKTTLLRTLAGLLEPQNGRVQINHDSFPSNGCHWFGTETCLKPDLTLMENIILWNWLDPIPSLQIRNALKIVGMDDHRDTLTRHLSSGQQRRAALTRLLLKEKPIWLLDEPDAYLDHQGHHLLTSLIEAHRNRGGVVIFASHHGLSLKNVRVLALSDFFPSQKSVSWS